MKAQESVLVYFRLLIGICVLCCSHQAKSSTLSNNGIRRHLPLKPWAVRRPPSSFYHFEHRRKKQKKYSQLDKEEKEDVLDDDDDYTYGYFEMEALAPRLASLAPMTPYVLVAGAVASIVGKVCTDPSIRRVLYFWKHGGPIIAHYRFTQFWLERVRRHAITVQERDAVYEKLHNRYADPTLQLILQLRGLYVKAGQVLSSRSDFMPRQYIERLATVQDDVPQLPIAKVRTIVSKSLRSEFGLAWDDVFESMDDLALGSASIGQVHRAVLQQDWFSSHQQQQQSNRTSLSSSSSSSPYRGGRIVACKVMHPNAKVCFARDFSVFRWVCRLVLPGFRPILNELERRIMSEFDYRTEADNLDEVRINMAASPYAKRVCVPQPLFDLTCRNVLVMEMLDGKKLLESIQDGVKHALGRDPTLMEKFRHHQHKKLLQATSSPTTTTTSSSGDDNSNPTDSFIQSLDLKTKLKLFLLRNRYRRYVKLLVRVHGYQIFVNGCFNGDPHPGNTLELRDGRLGLIDYGQTKHLTQDERLTYAKIVMAIGKDEHDSLAIAHVMREAGFETKDNTDNRALRDFALLFFDSDIEGRRRGFSTPALYFQALMSKNPLVNIPDSAVFIARSSLLFRGLGTALGTAPVRTAHIWHKHAERALQSSDSKKRSDSKEEESRTGKKKSEQRTGHI